MKRAIATLVSFVLLSLFAGCKPKGNSAYVFADPTGNLVAGIGEEQHHKLTWRAADPQLTQFWLKFDPIDFCENADSNGVIGSTSGKATCVVNGKADGSDATYQIYKQKPTKENPTDEKPKVNYLYVGPCKGCS